MDSRRQSTSSFEPEVEATQSQSGQELVQVDASHPMKLMGVEMGPIHPRFLSRKKWPLDNAEHIIQYHKFVQLMIHRIRAGESNDEETKLFTELIDYPDNYQYMVPASGMLPELFDPGPIATNIQMGKLLGHVKYILDVKEKKRIENRAEQPKLPQTADAITADARKKVAKLLFGPKGESNATPAMERLLTSWVDMGYPGKALEKVMEQDSKRGRGTNRDVLGLPTGLRSRRSRSRSRYPDRSRRAQKELSPAAQQSKQDVLRRNQPLPSDHYSSTENTVCASKDSLPFRKKTPDVPQQDPLIEPAGFTRKNAQGTYAPGDSDSPPASDDPPEDLLFEVDELDDDSPYDSKATTTGKVKSFWEFEGAYEPDYRGNAGPLPRDPCANPRFIWCRPVRRPTTRVTDDGTVVAEGFAKPKPAMIDAFLKVCSTSGERVLKSPAEIAYKKEMDKSQANFSRRCEARDAHHDEQVAKNRQEIEEARRKKCLADSSEDANPSEGSWQKEASTASVDTNSEYGCAISDTTSESEQELEIGKKIKSPMSDRAPTGLLSNPSTNGPPTLTGPASPKAIVDKKLNPTRGLNLQQVNQILKLDDGLVKRIIVDGGGFESLVSPNSVWLEYLKSTAEYAKERAGAEGYGGMGRRGSVDGYDAGPSAP
ncbi:MAG: hypothetical protein Q9226_006045 [Calogaya cf. arnoldii]